MQETPVLSLGWEDLLEKGEDIHSSIPGLPSWESACNAGDLGLGWEDPLEKGKATTPVFWSREFHGLFSPWGLKELDMTEQISLSFYQCTKKIKKCQKGL